MKVITNVATLIASEYGVLNQKSVSSSLEKLSYGLQINKASDDASGMAIADKLRTQRSGLNQSIDNANSAVALIQIADKAMSEQSTILDIIKFKLVQASTDTTSSDGRNAIARDINKLLDQLDDIASQTNYNGKTLLQKSTDDTNSAEQLIFQIGEKNENKIRSSGSIRANTNGLANSNVDRTLSQLKTDTSGDGSFLTVSKARTYLKTVDVALTDLNTMRSDLGSTQNQVESATRNILTAVTNIANAESVIRDVNYAKESANFSRTTIISNASSYAMSQANAKPQTVLQLLQ